jgi:hypothetical protein
MPDVRGLIVEYLAGFPALAARFEDRIWPGANLPHGFNPTAGGGQHALLFMRAGGGPLVIPVDNAQVRIECYGLDDIAAGDSADLVYETIHYKASATVASTCEVGPQYTEDPATKWAFGLVIVSFKIRLFSQAQRWEFPWQA